MIKRIIVSVICLMIYRLVWAQAENEIYRRFQKSYEYEKNSDFTNAINEIKNAEIIFPYEVYLRMAWLYYQSGEYLESVNFYRKAVQESPGSIEARMGMIYPLKAMQHIAPLIENYLEILRLDSLNHEALKGLGDLYLYYEDYPNAIRYFKTLYKLYPADYYAITSYYTALVKSHQNKEVTELENKIRLLFPEYPLIKNK